MQQKLKNRHISLRVWHIVYTYWKMSFDAKQELSGMQSTPWDYAYSRKAADEATDEFISQGNFWLNKLDPDVNQDTFLESLGKAIILKYAPTDRHYPGLGYELEGMLRGDKEIERGQR